MLGRGFAVLVEENQVADLGSITAADISAHVVNGAHGAGGGGGIRIIILRDARVPQHEAHEHGAPLLIGRLAVPGSVADIAVLRGITHLGGSHSHDVLGPVAGQRRAGHRPGPHVGRLALHGGGIRRGSLGCRNIRSGRIRSGFIGGRSVRGGDIRSGRLIRGSIGGGHVRGGDVLGGRSRHRHVRGRRGHLGGGSGRHVIQVRSGGRAVGLRHGGDGHRQHAQQGQACQ